LDLAQWIRDGGFFMWPILASAVIGFTLCLERLIYIYLRASIHAPVFMAQIQRDLLDGNFDGALRLCNAEAAAVLPKVLKAGLIRADRPEAELRDALEEASLEVYPAVTRRISFLPMIANVATLLGLLGTIQGLITCFTAVGQSDVESRSTQLAQGIAQSMNTTFAGLCVAVPVLVMHSLVAARANALLDEIDHYSLRLVNLLNATRYASAREPSGGGSGGGAPILPFRG